MSSVSQYSLKYSPSYVMSDSNIFVEEYYTGVDTEIYINGTKCDFITSIQYSLQEQLLPIYGYNSYAYDDVAIGNRIVVGSIKVPITNYDNLMRELNGQENELNTPTSRTISDDTSAPSWVQEGNFIARSNYKNILEDMYANNVPITNQNIQLYANDMSGGIGSNTSTDNPSVDTGNSDVTVDSAMVKKPKYDRLDSAFFKSEYYQSELDQEIVQKTIRKNHLDIEIRIGVMQKKILSDVIYRGVDNSHDSDGSPLFEILQFIARDLKEENTNIT